MFTHRKHVTCIQKKLVLNKKLLFTVYCYKCTYISQHCTIFTSSYNVNCNCKYLFMYPIKYRCLYIVLRENTQVLFQPLCMCHSWISY